MIIAAIRDAINDHITYVSSLHRLKFSTEGEGPLIGGGDMTGPGPLIYACVCGFAGDRSSWNDHIDEMYRVAALGPIDLGQQTGMQGGLPKDLKAKIEAIEGRGRVK